MTATSLADAHVHFFAGGFPGRYGRSPGGGAPEIDVYESLRFEHGVSRVLAIGYEGQAFGAGNNGYLRTLAATRPWIDTVAYVEADADPTPGRIEEVLEAGHRGLSIYVTDEAAADGWLAWKTETWQTLERTAAIVSLNIVPEALERSRTLIRSNAGCRFLISHLGLPGPHESPPTVREARVRLRALLDHAGDDNVYVKISGLYATSIAPHDFPHPTATPYVEALLEHFGTRRCVWGSDFAPVLDHVSFAQAASPVQLADLDDQERAAVMGANLEALLG